MVVRYLIHIAFTLKWVQYHNTNQLSPEIVLNFFNQWLDPLEMHSEEEVRDLVSFFILHLSRCYKVPLHILACISPLLDRGLS